MRFSVASNVTIFRHFVPTTESGEEHVFGYCFLFCFSAQNQMPPIMIRMAGVVTLASLRALRVSTNSLCFQPNPEVKVFNRNFFVALLL